MSKTWQKFAFLAAVGIGMTLSSTVPVRAEDALLVRSVPLEVSSYTEAATMDTSVKDAAGTVEYLQSTKPLLVHMEALRRAYANFGSNDDEHKKLMKALKDRCRVEKILC